MKKFLNCVLGFIVGGLIIATGVRLELRLESHISTAPIAFSDSGRNVYARAQESAAVLDIGDAYGSAVVIRRESADGVRVFAWTAKHCVSETNQVLVIRKVHFGTNVLQLSFTGDVIFRHPRTDAALLWVTAPDGAFRGASFDTDARTPHVGYPVFAVGNPLNFDGTVTRGIISFINRPDVYRLWPVTDQTDLRIAPGSSGCPVFSEDTGLVLGLIVGGPDAGNRAVFYVPVRELDSEGTFAWALRGNACPSDALLRVLASAYLPKKADANQKPESGAVNSATNSVIPPHRRSWNIFHRE